MHANATLSADSLAGQLSTLLQIDGIRVGYITAGLVAVVSSLLVYRSQRSSQAKPSRYPASTTSSEATPDPNKNRENGEWTPVKFTYPPIAACPHPLADIKPIPYRPFRYGEYHITMGIRNMPWDDWIELDQQFESYHRIRAQRVKECGKDVVRVLPATPGVVGSGHEAAVELVHELAEYLSRRYPATFRVSRHDTGDEGWDGASAIQTVTIVPLGITYDLDAQDPMEVAAMLVQDDLALMIEGADRRYYFQAGAICVPGFWRLRDKIGLPLDEIHLTGHVPQFAEKLQTSLARFFHRLPPAKPVIRNNYFIQIVSPAPPAASLDPDELAWSSTTNGPEDTFAHGERCPVAPTAAPGTLRLRTERQTLRRLPKSGAVVFTIRTYLFPVEELGRERGVPGRLASAVRGWGEDVMRYKGSTLYREVLLDYLDECHRRQVEQGEVGTEERVPAVYPY